MDLNVKTLSITDHAAQRAIERFKCKDKLHALNYCKSLLANPTSNIKYIGLQTSEDGGESHLFTNGKVNFHISKDLKKIKTVMPVRERSYLAKVEDDNPLKHKLIKLYQTEMKKYDREENSRTKSIHKIKMDFSVELAELNYRMYKTRSEAVKTSCAARIKAINDYISEHETTLTKLKNDKRKIAKAMTSLM